MGSFGGSAGSGIGCIWVSGSKRGLWRALRVLCTLRAGHLGGNRGSFTLADLDDVARMDPAVLSLAQRIDCAHDGRSRYPDAFSGGVRITLKDGTELEHFEAVNRGAEGRLLSSEQVKAKFLDNCALTIPTETAQQLWSAMLNLDEINDVADLTALLRTEANRPALLPPGSKAC